MPGLGHDIGRFAICRWLGEISLAPKRISGVAYILTPSPAARNISALLVRNTTRRYLLDHRPQIKRIRKCLLPTPNLHHDGTTQPTELLLNLFRCESARRLAVQSCK